MKMVVEENNDKTAPENEKEVKLITLEILKIIKDAQQQHGLRHGDYQRYRGYCSRRISRLRKVLKIPQGDRRHFKRRDVTEAHLASSKADERLLQVPLVLAERCWAYAMQLRQEANTEVRKKFHLVQKLRKACVYALQLDQLCKQDKCDARTRLESQAYLSWIQGTLQFELQLWPKAHENLKQAQVIYEKLAQTLSEEEQQPYKSRVEEIAPSLRYCAYNIGDEKAVDLLELRSQGVLDTFEPLLAKQQKEKSAQVLHEIDWFGKKIRISLERVRLFLISIEKLDESLAKAEDNQAKIKILENLFIDLRDVISVTRDQSRVDKIDPLLLPYLLSIRIERTCQRNLLLIWQTRKPQDCVRLLDINIQQTNELTQNEALKDFDEAQKYFKSYLEAYRTIRTYYLGRTQVQQKHFKEAAVLFDNAFKSIKDSSKFKFTMKELENLFKHVQEKAEIDSVNARAQLVLTDKEEVLNLPQKTYKSKKALSERLDEFREEPQLLSKNPNLVNVPPPMEPVPAKPLFYDLALNFVEFPDLQEKLESNQQGTGKQKQGAAGISGFVKGLWGWGSKK